MVRALSRRESEELERLGVSVVHGPRDGAGSCDCNGAPSDCGGPCSGDEALPEREVPTTWDWSLLRKFNDFWPSTMSAPHDFPWLGDLVTRERAWRWASQFPRFFALVEASDSDIIRAFIARTLTEVEPPSPYEGESEEEKKGCCKKKEPAPPPPKPRPPLHPGPDEPGWEVTEWWTEWKCGPPDCPEGLGKERVVYSDGRDGPETDCMVTPMCATGGSLVMTQAPDGSGTDQPDLS